MGLSCSVWGLLSQAASGWRSPSRGEGIPMQTGGWKLAALGSVLVSGGLVTVQTQQNLLQGLRFLSPQATSPADENADAAASALAETDPDTALSGTGDDDTSLVLGDRSPEEKLQRTLQKKLAQRAAVKGSGVNSDTGLIGEITATDEPPALPALAAAESLAHEFTADVSDAISDNVASAGSQLKEIKARAQNAVATIEDADPFGDAMDRVDQATERVVRAADTKVQSLSDRLNSAAQAAISPAADQPASTHSSTKSPKSTRGGRAAASKGIDFRSELNPADELAALAATARKSADSALALAQNTAEKTIDDLRSAAVEAIPVDSDPFADSAPQPGADATATDVSSTGDALEAADPSDMAPASRDVSESTEAAMPLSLPPLDDQDVGPALPAVTEPTPEPTREPIAPQSRPAASRTRAPAVRTAGGTADKDQGLTPIPARKKSGQSPVIQQLAATDEELDPFEETPAATAPKKPAAPAKKTAQAPTDEADPFADELFLDNADEPAPLPVPTPKAPQPAAEPAPRAATTPPRTAATPERVSPPAELNDEWELEDAAPTPPAKSTKPAAGDPARPPGLELSPVRPQGASRGKPSKHELTGDGVVTDQSPRGVQQPRLTVEKVAPKQAVLGEPLIYSVVIKNTGTQDAHHVLVEDRIPKGTELQGTSPKAELNDKRLVWRLGTLKANESRELRIKVIPLEEGNLGSIAKVTFAAEVGAEVEVSAPQLAWQVDLPPRAKVGETFPLTFVVKNVGKVVAEDVTVRDVLPAGLSHPAGKDVEYVVGRLAPGESREVVLEVGAAEKGRKQNRTLLTAKGGIALEEKTTIDVLGEPLVVSRRGPEKTYVQRPAKFVNFIKNDGPDPLSEVQISEAVPAGFEFVEASQGGRFDPVTGMVTWRVPKLQPGEEVSVGVRLMTKAKGTHESQVMAIGAGTGRVSVTSQTTAEGLPQLSFEPLGDNRLIGIGEKVISRLQVKNTGTADARNVYLVVDVPPGLEFVSAKGPSRYKASRDQIVFDPLPQLPMGKLGTYELEFQALDAGDQHLGLQVGAEHLSKPLSRDEPIQVINEQQ